MKASTSLTGISTFAAVAVAICAEAGLVLQIILSNELTAEAVMTQLVISAGVGWWSFTLYQKGERRLDIFLFVLSVVALGPMGAGGGALMFLAHRVAARFAVPFEQWYSSLFPWMEKDKVRHLYEIIAWRGAGPASQSSVAPFSDVLALGTVEQKQAAVTLISDYFRPEFSSALRCALNDPEPAIRVQAASAAARIENQFLDRSVALEAARAKDADDPDLLREIAQHHETYAGTGLLDTGRANAARQQALDLYLLLLRDRPEDQTLVESAARLQLQLERPAEALQLLEPWMMKEDVNPALASHYAEALFCMGSFDRLRDVCTRQEHKLNAGSLSEEARASIRLWSRSTSASA